MNLQIKHYGLIKNGKKEYYLPDLYHDQLRQLEGKQFMEIIKEVHKKPSNNQHAYYRGCILVVCYKTEMFSHMDNKDAIHEDYFAPKFLGYKHITTVGGKNYEFWKVRSLSDLNKDEISDFITRVKADCELNGISIPDSDQFYNKYYETRNNI